ncbi:hypothetical protein [Nonomuraea sp. NPDC005501]|uniref:hypothetical protein n=1 Tax=Nonomuraea sp. NPDC005501 TaxID=3156884 RepID=UPI0033B0BB55
MVERDEVPALVALEVTDRASPELSRREEGRHDEAGLVDPEAGIRVYAPAHVLDLMSRSSPWPKADQLPRPA